MTKFNNQNIRRQNRILDEESAMKILQNGEYGVLSMVEANEDNLSSGYGLPLNYVCDEDNIYFHCAFEGHKISILENNPLVSFVVVGKTQVISNEYTTCFESVLVRGSIERNMSDDQRRNALVLFLDKYSPEDKEVGLQYIEKSLARTEILKLKIYQISAKAKHM